MLKKYEIFFIAILISGVTHSQEVYKRTVKLMGSRFDITVVAGDIAQGNSFIDMAVEEISRIEKLISSWDPNSQTSNINKNAGIQVTKVDQELFDLIERSLYISKLTEGAFDISYASMDKVWKFDGSMVTIPTEEVIKASVSKVGYSGIKLDKKNSTIFLTKTGMKIGFGAIGKGYAADKAKELLRSKGVVAGIINASGDMNTWGKQPNGKDWQVAITNPLNKSKAFALLPVKEGAVVTSGNYEKYVIFEGKRYTHIIDPRTGYPSTGIVSVTVFAPKAELADALATSIFVMGPDVGMHLINQLKDLECIIVKDDGSVWYSDHLEKRKI
ncbi:FAD:protein FMN transferase [Aquimarina sp. 2201CG5-10]|uniref:FAD:protein FMN transferase n=1 Tax=Aquimarina callyspongiae TaxID=3098150 RepID=UPI002AB5D6B8|nr:FAD:protein FMN transferase [Aquimarina sp. 2201CG5-10]MDY8134890.1 FAD:protein FMN transferase [Aquimarina sp. 2201CG5-10]